MSEMENINPDMNIKPICPIDPIPTDGSKTEKVEGPNFKEFLKNSINEMNDLNQQAEQAVEKLASGEVKDIHEVMIAVEKANMTFSMMMQIRNKLMQAYQEVSRMRF